MLPTALITPPPWRGYRSARSKRMKEAKKEADSITKAFRADKGAGQLPEKHAEGQPGFHTKCQY